MEAKGSGEFREIPAASYAEGTDPPPQWTPEQLQASARKAVADALRSWKPTGRAAQ